MGHKHKKEKRKHRSRSRSRSVEKERERERERERDRERERSKHRHHKRHHKDKRAEKRPKDDSPTYISSDDDCIVVPPPPKISRQATPPPPPPPAISNAAPESSSGAGDSLSIEETNRIRAKLGLKPLQVDEKPTSVEVRADNEYKNSTEKTAAEFGLDVINDDLGEFVHKPADNLAKKVKAEKLKEKLAERRAKRAMEQKLSRIKKLGESSSDEEESATSWIDKSRKIAEEKAQAEKRAKLLEEMDEEFGVGELVAEEMKTERRKVYGTKDLKGLRVEHDLGSFGDGKQVILTLKDQGVLEEDGDVLVNVNMLDDEHHKKNIDRRKQKPGYNAYDEEEEMDTLEEPQVLSKYDEEIDGAKKKSFTIGVDDSAASLARKREEALSVKNKLMKKRLETLAMPAPKLAAEYYNEEEINTKFKKVKKVKKVRKKGILKADDLAALTKPEDSGKDFGSRRIRSRIVDDDDELKAPPPPRISAPDDVNMKEEPMEIDLDDLPPLPADIATIKVEPEEDLQLELALKKARRLMQRDAVEEAANVEKLARSIVKEELQAAFGETEPGGSIVLNSTAEFCRTLGDIPTYGLAGNRDEDAEELLDFEREMIEEQRRRQEEDGKRGAWNEVEGDEPPAEIEPTETPILDPEPDLGGGMAGALRLAVSKGYLEKEIVKRPSASRLAYLQAQNYSIEDKTHAEDDKFGRRERYAGPTSEFKDKDGYKPNVKLDYIDDEGHVLNAKEAFRYLSHKFHGKGPGKNKVEKRMKKKEQDALMKQMSSTDTPLGTLNMLQAKQKETQSAFIVLSGGKHQTATISKTKLSK